VAVAITQRDQRPGDLAALERDLTLWHADAVAQFRKAHDIQPDVIGFHGQTVLHRPAQALTVQLGDGGLLAAETGIQVVADMRAADVAAGGQGAPLVPAYHAALAAGLAARPAAFVNIGGVANITFIARDGALLAFDTGPGNALLDDWALKHTGRAVDEGGALAASGSPDEAMLEALLAHPYFAAMPPKSLDRQTFAALTPNSLNPENGAATLTAFTARSIAAAADWLEEMPEVWVITGGGRHNPALMGMLREVIPARVIAAEDAGFDGDAMEAEAWGYLAVRSLKGLPLSFPGTTKVDEPMTGGVLHLSSSRT
jgi:anhydro-N-acetylmuramic acid kinase